MKAPAPNQPVLLHYQAPPALSVEESAIPTLASTTSEPTKLEWQVICNPEELPEKILFDPCTITHLCNMSHLCSPKLQKYLLKSSLSLQKVYIFENIPLIQTRLSLHVTL